MNKYVHKQVSQHTSFSSQGQNESKSSMQYWEIDTERKKTEVATDFEVNG